MPVLPLHKQIRIFRDSKWIINSDDTILHVMCRYPCVIAACFHRTFLLHEKINTWMEGGLKSIYSLITFHSNGFIIVDTVYEMLFWFINSMLTSLQLYADSTFVKVNLIRGWYFGRNLWWWMSITICNDVTKDSINIATSDMILQSSLRFVPQKYHVDFIKVLTSYTRSYYENIKRNTWVVLMM